MQPGHVVATPYGFGTLTNTRDNVHELRLPFGRLYAHRSSIEGYSPDHETLEDINAKKAMKLNEAYEALETMRRANFELKCQEIGISANHHECSTCVVEEAGKEIRFPRINKFVKDQKSKPIPCLACATPTCIKHSSESFRLENITVCNSCEKVFHLDFMLDCITLQHEQRLEKLNHLADMYDRTGLLLTYSCQYIDDIADALDTTKKVRNHINVGGSSAGIVSGVLGVAAACTLFTPAGAPLLITSLLFGGAATAAQTTSDVHNKYFFEPAKLAGRILALHGMLASILTVTSTLRLSAIEDFKRRNPFTLKSPILVDLEQAYIKNHSELLLDIMDRPNSQLSSKQLSRLVAATERERQKKAESTVNAYKSSGNDAIETQVSIATRNTRYLSRIGSGLMRTASFAPILGGALSGATLLLEATNIATTVSSMKKGSACEKATALRQIQDLIGRGKVPETSCVEKECKSFLRYMDVRRESALEMSPEEAVLLLLRQANSEAKRKESGKDHPPDESNIFLDMNDGKYNFEFREDGTVSITGSGDRSVRSDWVLHSDELEEAAKNEMETANGMQYPIANAVEELPPMPAMPPPPPPTMDEPLQMAIVLDDESLPPPPSGPPPPPPPEGHTIK